MGVFQKPVFEGLLRQALPVSDDPRLQPHDSVDQRNSRGFAAGKNEISEANLFDVAGLENTLVQTLEPAADQRDDIDCSDFPYAVLGQRCAARREIKKELISSIFKGKIE